MLANQRLARTLDRSAEEKNNARDYETLEYKSFNEHYEAYKTFPATPSSRHRSRNEFVTIATYCRA